MVFEYRAELAVRSDKLVVAPADEKESFEQPTEVFQPDSEQAEREEDELGDRK